MPLDSRTMSKADYVEWNLLDNAYLLCHTEPLLVQLNFLHFLMGVESVVRVLCNDIERLDVLPLVQHCESFDSYAVSEQTKKGGANSSSAYPIACRMAPRGSLLILSMNSSTWSSCQLQFMLSARPRSMLVEL